MLMRDMHRTFTRCLEQRISTYGITTNMWFYLRALWENDGATPRELSELLGIKGPTTNQALGDLERRGLISRERDTTDRRLVRIRLTPAGVELKNTLLTFAVEVQDIALSDVSEEEAEIFRDVLQRMKTSLGADYDRALGSLG